MGVNGIYGLSGSGLDIESLVKMGMSGKNKQYDKMEQQEIANTWLKEAYNDVYMDMTTYKYGTLSTYKMQSNMNAMQATSNNTSLVTATANGAAAAMNHTVEISSVASNAYLQTAQFKQDGSAVTGIERSNKDAQTSSNLADVLFESYEVASATQSGNNYNFEYKVKFAGASDYTIVKGSDIAISMKLKDTANSDTEYTLTYTYDELFTGVKSGAYTDYSGPDDLFSDGKTLYDFANAIGKTGANIQGGYDTANDSFSLYNKTSGKDNIIGITADNTLTATLLNHLYLGSYDAATNKLGKAEVFKADNTMETTMESAGITNSALSVSLKDVLGLKATSVKNGDNYDITVTDNKNNQLGVFKVNASGNPVTEGTDTTVFSINLSNGTQAQDKTISFTLGDLFDLSDIGKKSNLGGGAGLSDFAQKISEAGIGITANYDSAKDSFSLINTTGQAKLTVSDSNTNKSVGQSLIDSLHLGDVSGVHLKTATIDTTNGTTLADILKISSTVKGVDDITMRVNQGSTEIGSIVNGSPANYTNNTYANRTLFSFDISDGSDPAKTATVNITYGDVANFAGMREDGGSLWVKDADGNDKFMPSYSSSTVSVQSAQNTFQVLVDKINAAAGDGGLNLSASYDSTNGNFSIVSKAGIASLTKATGANGTKFDLSTILGLADAPNTSYAYMQSGGITRAVEHSTEDMIADGLGISAVKNGDTLTIKKSDGTEVGADETAFTLKIGDGTNQAEVTYTYGDLFDANGNSKTDLSALAEKINTVANDNHINVTAAYNGATGKFSLTNEHGYATLTGVDDLGKELVSRMGITESEETASAKDHSWAGTNAAVTIDGKTYDNDTNKLTVAGVTYTFLDAAVGTKATISVSQDTDKIVDYVKSFVDDYNKLLDSLNEKLAEKKYSDYKPLSKRQEDEMTEKQIEKWNEKAKSGLLYHNSEIQDLVSAMREAIYSKVDAVDSQYNTLSSIGITSTNTKGHLTLDTDKLKKALAEDPDCVYQLFASDQDSTYIAGSTNKNKITTAQSKLDYANTGIANRLDNIMTTHMKKISDIAGTSKDTDDQSYLGKLITQMQTKMQSFKTLMSSYENKLYKRYDAMEVALSKLNMQLGYISGSFS